MVTLALTAVSVGWHYLSVKQVHQSLVRGGGGICNLFLKLSLDGKFAHKQRHIVLS